jgi:hypothetical protein
MRKDDGRAKGKDRDTDKRPFWKNLNFRKRRDTPSNPAENKGGESSAATLLTPQHAETEYPVLLSDGVPTQPLQQQDKQTQSQLWKEAAKSLEQKDQKKLELIKSRQKGPVADTSPKAQRAGSPPDGHGKDPSADDVNLILDRAKGLKKESKEATWRPVSAISSVYGGARPKSLPTLKTPPTPLLLVLRVSSTNLANAFAKGYQLRC